MKNAFKVLTLLFTSLLFLTCTESDLILEEIGGNGTTNPGTQNPSMDAVLSTYSLELNANANSEITTLEEYSTTGLATRASNTIKIDVPPLSLDNATLLTFTRDANSRITGVNIQNTDFGTTATQTSVIEYDSNGEVSQITFTENGTDIVSTFTHTANQTMGEIKNGTGTVIAKLTLDFDANQFPTKARNENADASEVYESTITLTNGNITQIENSRNGTVTDTKTYEYDTNTNPLGNANYNAADNKVILLHNFGTTTYNDGSLFLDDDFFGGFELNSSNNITKSTEDSEVTDYTYTYSSDASLPLSAIAAQDGTNIGTITYTYHE